MPIRAILSPSQRRREAIRRAVESGDGARDRRDWSAAKRFYAEALALAPHRHGVWVQLGHATKEAGDAAGAVDCYARALALKPDIADTHLQIGHAHKLLGRLAEARDAYAEARRLAPGDVAIAAELAAVEARLDERARRLTKIAADARLIRESGLFDEDWYAARHPEAAAAGLSPVEHYLLTGAEAGCDPSSRFDTSFYLRANPELRRYGVNPLKHYILSGRAEGRPAAPAANEPAPAAAALAGLPHDEIRRRLEGAFDAEFYLRRHDDVARMGADPLRHFIEAHDNWRDPAPWFSTRFYLETQPDVARAGVNPLLHYLEIGKATGARCSPVSAGGQDFDHLCGMLGQAPEDVEALLEDRRCDLRARLSSGELAEMFDRAAELDPLIRHARLAALTLAQPQFRNADEIAQTTAMDRLQQDAGRRRAEAVVVIPWNRLGGATRYAGHLTRALAGIFGARTVAVIRTEESGVDYPGWFPDGVRDIDFAGRSLLMPARMKRRLCFEFIRSLRPRHVFNVNAPTMWALIETWPEQLRAAAQIHAVMFCNERNVHGDWEGYPLSMFHNCLEHLDHVFTDSRALAEELTERFMLCGDAAAKLIALPTPAPVTGPAAPPPAAAPGRRPRVYWAGRLDRQKRVDLAYAVAAAALEFDFLIWGEAGGDPARVPAPPGNVRLMGRYDDFADLPLADCDAWLYTSEWDGAPNMLLEVAAAGLPLVGSLVGGAGEVLRDGFCHRVRDIEDVGAYVAGLRAIVAAPDRARANAARLRELVLDEHAPARFQDALVRSLGA